MAKMRVTIRYSLNSDTSNRLAAHVEGRLNEIGRTIAIGGLTSHGTATREFTIDDTDWPKFGAELGAIFRHLYCERKTPDAMLDHFWMYCDVIDKTPSPLALPGSKACA